MNRGLLQSKGRCVEQVTGGTNNILFEILVQQGVRRLEPVPQEKFQKGAQEPISFLIRLRWPQKRHNSPTRKIFPDSQLKTFARHGFQYKRWDILSYGCLWVVEHPEFYERLELSGRFSHTGSLGILDFL